VSMLQALTMPKWGLSMEEGTIVEWKVKQGDKVRAGDELVEVETSKIMNTVEATHDGLLQRIVAQVGDTLPCGRPMAVIGTTDATEAEIDQFLATYVSEGEQSSGTAGQSPEPEVFHLDGSRIRFFRTGAGGLPIVLLHGFGGDLDNWLFLQTDLATTNSTIAFDLPGHGGSGKSLKDGSAQELAAVILRALDALDVQRAHLIGHSFGAMVAASLAAADANRVASLTAIAPAGVGSEINSEYIQGFIKAKRRSELTKIVSLLFADPSVVTPNMVETLLRAKRVDGAEAALLTIAAANFPGDRQKLLDPVIWSAIAAKLLVIWGERDAIIPSAQMERLPANVKRILISDAGHMPHLERPAEVATAVRRHLTVTDHS
jgi:pyruvate dehydrogenase E2 component (dihydrolipoamide acetyltransferase)